MVSTHPPTHIARPVSRIGHPSHDDKTANTLAVRRAEPLHAPALTAKARRPVSAPRFTGLTDASALVGQERPVGPRGRCALLRT